MARPLRVLYPGAVHHAARGNERRAIFRDDTDRHAFFARLGLTVGRFGWICQGFCLVGNPPDRRQSHLPPCHRQPAPAQERAGCTSARSHPARYAHRPGSGAIDQVRLDTTGSVALGPESSGLYTGLTIFQDRALRVVPATTTCASLTNYSTAPSANQLNAYDILLQSTASTGPNGELGSVSGTIYAPAPRAMFADSVSGEANLAVFSSCILIDGGTSTFDFQSSGLFGTGEALTE